MSPELPKYDKNAYYLLGEHAIRLRNRIHHVSPSQGFKAIGGGSRSKFCFLMILVGNFMYFHMLFTEFENFKPLAQKWPERGEQWG